MTARSPWVPALTTTPTRSREEKSTNGVITACLACSRGLEYTASTEPIGIPATYGEPRATAPGDDHVVLARGLGVVDQVQVEPPVAGHAAPAAEEADLGVRAQAGADHRVLVDEEQHRGGPVRGVQHAADEAVVVEHRHVGVDPGAGARRRWSPCGRTTAPDPSRPRGRGRARSRCCARPGAGRRARRRGSGPRRWSRPAPRRLAFSACSRAMSARRVWLRLKNPGTCGERTGHHGGAVLRPGRAGRPTRSRAGSSGESSPPWESTAIAVDAGER